MSTQNLTTATTPKEEIKVALPADFSRKPTDATCWVKAYFSINPQIYHNDKIKIATILNKMSLGKGIPFSEIWYDKMENAAIKLADKDLTHFIDDFEKKFCPFDIREKACWDISKLYQKSRKDKDGTPNDGFHNYITAFQNLATKAKFEDKLTASIHFSAGLDWQISTMILFMATLPNNIEGWIKKVKPFHDLRIDNLRARNCFFTFHPNLNSSSS